MATSLDADGGDGTSQTESAKIGASRLRALQIELAELTARCGELEESNRSLTERVHAANAITSRLAGSEARYRTILDSEPACVKLVDKEGLLLSMNPAGLAMIDADSESMVLGLCVYDLVCAKDRQAFIEMNRRVFRGESASLEFEIEGLRGTHRRMETFAAPLLDQAGRVVAQLAVTHDVTARNAEQIELQAYREQLEALVDLRTRELEASREESRRAERLASLGTLATGLAHELNNPLGTILLGIEMIRIAEDPDSLDAAIEGIRRDVVRCNHIIKSMARFGRDEPSDKIPVCLNQIVRSARDHSRQSLDSHRISIELDLEEVMPSLRGNATELVQVLINLIQNAVIASDAGGRIWIRTRRTDSNVRCEVEDAGCGMAPETRLRACDPFFTTHLERGGTGLGLSVSHGIVTDHRGRLDIESWQGRGTIVSISLPTTEAQPSSRI